jgi:hypothetical protein
MMVMLACHASIINDPARPSKANLGSRSRVGRKRTWDQARAACLRQVAPADCPDCSGHRRPAAPAAADVPAIPGRFALRCGEG